MSELTPCNYCTLRAIRQREGSGRVTVTSPDPLFADSYPESVTVEVDGFPVAHMLALTDSCAC